MIGDITKAAGCRSLGITINHQDTIAAYRKVLSEVHRADRLGDTPFEALHGEYFAGLPFLAPRGGAKNVAQFVDLIQCVATDPARVGVLHGEHRSVGVFFLAGEGSARTADHSLRLGHSKLTFDVLLHLG